MYSKLYLLLLFVTTYRWSSYCLVSSTSTTYSHSILHPSLAAHEQLATTPNINYSNSLNVNRMKAHYRECPKKHSLEYLLNYHQKPLLAYVTNERNITQANLLSTYKKVKDFFASSRVESQDDSNSSEINNDIDDNNYYFGDPDDETAAPDDEDSFIYPIIRHWERTPPITKLYLTSSMSVTVYSYLFLKNIWPTLLKLNWPAVFSGHVWRPISCFLFLGNFSLSYILTTQFVWNYMSSLEKMMCKKPEMFLAMVLFGMTSLLVTYPMFGLASHMIGHNLAIYFVYLWSKLHEGEIVNVMELFEIKAEYLPWIFFGQSWLFGGEPPISDLIGIGFGALFHHLYFQRKIALPQSLVEFYNKPWIQNAYKKFREEHN